MYAFKGLILVFGLFLAYETRSIKVKQINDSRYVGMSIYNVVILTIITAPVSMVIGRRVHILFLGWKINFIFDSSFSTRCFVRVCVVGSDFLLFFEHASDFRTKSY